VIDDVPGSVRTAREAEHYLEGIRLRGTNEDDFDDVAV
jgi:hypothetical protein